MSFRRLCCREADKEGTEGVSANQTRVLFGFGLLLDSCHFIDKEGAIEMFARVNYPPQVTVVGQKIILGERIWNGESRSERIRL